ncbi:MAG: guanylyltransferase [Planctomycetaceae bacterium]|nr:guanylyltransferase [Planctomycetaceae bacterium]
MKFNELDSKMRIYETAADLCVLPEMHMVARLDGRNFTRLTKETTQFEVPFDVRFRDLMIRTCESLMTCGFQVRYAYTQSDEISVLFDLNEQLFGRKLRKFNSTLAGEASSQFSIRFGKPVCFDCRISQLPTPELVIDYFRWRNEDAARNALNAWCYWTLRERGKDKQQATNQLLKMSVARKNELLFQCGINFNDLPAWQKRGSGLYWETYNKQSANPLTNETVFAERRRIRVDLELPMKKAYEEFVRSLIGKKEKGPVTDNASD